MRDYFHVGLGKFIVGREELNNAPCIPHTFSSDSTGIQLDSQLDSLGKRLHEYGAKKFPIIKFREKI